MIFVILKELEIQKLTLQKLLTYKCSLGMVSEKIQKFLKVKCIKSILNYDLYRDVKNKKAEI